MKKILIAILALMILISLSVNAFGLNSVKKIKQSTLNYANQSANIEQTYYLKKDGIMLKDTIKVVSKDNNIFVPIYKLSQAFKIKCMISNKDSIITMNIRNEKIEFKLLKGKISIMNKKNSEIGEYLIISNQIFIPINYCANNLNLNLSISTNNKIIELDDSTRMKANIGKTTFLFQKSIENVSISVDKIYDYKVIKMVSPYRLVIDFPDTLSKSTINNCNLTNKNIKQIRTGQFEKNTARLVIELNNDFGYNIVEKNGKLDIQFLYPSSVINNYSYNKLNLNIVNLSEVKTTYLASNNSKNSTTMSSILKKSIDIDFKQTRANNSDEISFNLQADSICEVKRKTDPESIVIKVNEVEYNNYIQNLGTITALVEKINLKKIDNKQCEFEIFLNKQENFEFRKENNRAVLKIIPSKISNISYHNNGDRVYVLINNAKMTEGGENLKKLYEERTELSGKKKIISFKNNGIDYGSDKINVKDLYLENFEIINKGQETEIIFNSNSELKYIVMTREQEDNSAITIVKKSSITDKLVIIDPGHGGSETGAINGDLLEKNLNLDISKRVNELLKNNNIKTYIMRENDTFVGLYERTEIANNLNGVLFLSIHNNAYESSFNGTETLYFPDKDKGVGIKSIEFADLIQKKVINKLQTKDRGIVSRPNLVVLKATEMTSALAEIAFITNLEDREKLKSDDFKQKAAEALSDAVIQALKYVN